MSSSTTVVIDMTIAARIALQKKSSIVRSSVSASVSSTHDRVDHDQDQAERQDRERQGDDPQDRPGHEVDEAE